MTPPLPIPPEFRTVAPTMSIQDAALRFEVSEHTIAKWCKQLGVQAIVGRIFRIDPPANFADLAKKLNVKQIAEQCRVSHTTVRRWLKRTGVRPSINPTRTWTPEQKQEQRERYARSRYAKNADPETAFEAQMLGVPVAELQTRLQRGARP